MATQRCGTAKGDTETGLMSKGKVSRATQTNPKELRTVIFRLKEGIEERA